ncbi:MAG TPA: response regulator transcription factor [Alphaproteobacteria bacterium]|nr:response regulator transcription factor [Alphaproteobacteria bacterium]
MTAHILIVEDDEQIQQFVALHLTNEGYRVSTALTGERMFDILTTDAADLIILDLNLPDADGLNLAQRIRQTSSVPIIVASARKRVDDRLKALKLGADDYLTKPFDTRELILRVRNVLERSAGQAAGQSAPPRRRHSLALAVLALALALVLIAGGGAYWYGGGEIPLLTRPQPAPKTASSSSVAPASNTAPSSNPAPAASTLPATYSWVAASQCEPFPSVAWWKNKSHLAVVRYVDRRHAGNWDAYVQSWQGRLVKLQDIQDRGSTAVTASGGRLSGTELAAYLEQMSKRIEVTRCLVAEAKAARK